MGTQTPKAASTRSSFGPHHRYASRSNAIDVDSRDTPASPWHSSITCSEGHIVEGRHSAEQTIRAYTSEEIVSRDGCSHSPPLLYHPSIPEELADLIRVMIPEQEGVRLSGEELAEQFLEASDVPPVTKQSLSELDIQSIITNIKLRHDVNFDRDLSFRPNLDGIKGQEKERSSDKYWMALVAELVLYNRLFQGTPPISQDTLAAFTSHAQRRIPKLFETVRDVLKSLVPDRDHSRVDEHLDVPMLMQAIERGVCDLVRLAEWMAQLLKEHCAPMRDGWVDDMVASTREGVVEHNLEKIVGGLKGLFGILEAMKLDVANHQIRNLKTLLIDDTVNFEKHYHLDRLVNGRARVNINIAQSWFADAVEEIGPQCLPRPKAGPCFQLEIFTRAVVATSFGRDGRSDFPDTFFLDHDRLGALKAEVDDLVMFEVCMDMFIALARQFGYDGHLSLAIDQQLRTAIAAIMAEAAGHGRQQWMMNSEALSLEILRQASCLVGQSPTFSFDRMADVNRNLRALFMRRSAYHAARLEAALLPQILGSVDRHSTSSPMDLFTSLVPLSLFPSLPPLPTLSRPSTSDTFDFTHLHPETAKLTDLINRLTHIILLHWRVWGPIAYLQDDEPQHSSAASSPDASMTPSPIPQAQSRSPPNAEQEASLPTTMRTGETMDPGQETHVAHQSLPQ
ncbi:camp-mediated signaling protein Sok [Decorospora gaudefroyi]|uniref:Camp-mediated signaling protein Sok n=1 Tax=Decorospora gaudefroyi TaxID=184978 RepID=A0A6A5KC22_9PLEO|nr:camp-mediated signaling protein Sok [Decorospora gaudefroyi]